MKLRPTCVYCVHLDDVLYLLFSEDVSGRVARVDDSNTSDLRAVSAGRRKRLAQVFHLTHLTRSRIQQ